MDPGTVALAVSTVSALGAVGAAVVAARPGLRKARADDGVAFVAQFESLVERQAREIERIDKAVQECQDDREVCERDRRALAEELHDLRRRVDGIQQVISKSGDLEGGQ
jgi:Mg2+ and Co2+ transporter CorA